MTRIDWLETEMGLWATMGIPVELSQLKETTEQIYTSILSSPKRRQYCHIVRIWNEVPQINQFHGGIESYQIFCAGRKNAFERFQLQSGSYPAASAVGSLNQDLRVRFLFSKSKPIQLENPFQMKAYHYPNLYGPTPPSFSRGSLCHGEVFLSGTASIRGHETLEPFHTLSQLKWTFENLETILAIANQKLNLEKDRKHFFWKVFLRNPSDLAELQGPLNQFLGSHWNYQEADLCRKDLMVEIEGSSIEIPNFEWPSPNSSPRVSHCRSL